MMNRDCFWLTKDQFARLKPLLPSDTRRKPRVDDRRVTRAIFSGHHLGAKAVVQTHERHQEYAPPRARSGAPVGGQGFWRRGGAWMNARGRGAFQPLKRNIPPASHVGSETGGYHGYPRRPLF